MARTFCTGKLPPKPHVKTLDFSKYVATNLLPSPSAKVYREYKVPASLKQMWGNDLYGDCVWAMIVNYLILATLHTGRAFTPTLQDALDAYAAVTGFSAGPPATNDNGTAMTDAFAYWQTNGVAGHKILGWCKIDHTNLVHRQLGVDLFGATFTGVQLPDNTQDQFNAGQNWELTRPPDPDDGHAILHPGYGSEGDDYWSWAKPDQKASAEWSAKCVDEEYVVVTEDWINQVTQRTPGGLYLNALQADLGLMRAA